MNILITNDDGFFAKGLALLAEEASAFGKVTVVAPHTNCSGASSSLTIDNPLRYRKMDNGFYSVEGTPTDCTHVALHHILNDKPDLILSGINHGANLGDDVLYSGTVAAALEARYFHCQAFAFSLASFACDYFETAREVVKTLLMHYAANPKQPGSVINVNIPDVPLSELAGYQVTRCGHRHQAQPIQQAHDQKGREIFWLAPPGEGKDTAKETDFHAIQHNYVSMTPLQVDLTAHQQRQQISQQFRSLL